MKFIKDFLKLESSGGIVLGLSALVAIVLKNSAVQAYYDALISFPLAIVFVNDFLMSAFFLLVGLELKREWIDGKLSDKKNRRLPAIAALGGIIFPALIYVYFSVGNRMALNGWAIPVATDIAFALGVLALLGKRVPEQLKICLLSLAIFDDIAAVLIIAIFYMMNLSCYWLLASCIPLGMLLVLNIRCVKPLTPYMIVGLVLWFCIVKSGIHATVSGIILAFFIPLKMRSSFYGSPLKDLEHAIHPWVSFGVLPVFAFFNAGVSLEGLSLDTLTHPIALGITAGLFLGKQMGVMLFSTVAIKLKWCHLPKNVTWLQYYGMAVITGIGFTMSLFVGTLAFSEVEYQITVRLGVIMGSALSLGLGYCILFYALKKT